MTAFVIL